MRDTLTPRDYQIECLDLIRSAWYNLQRPAVVLPTGAGKTVIFAHLASEWLEREHTRVVVLVHRDELADQAIAKIRAVAPGLDVGKVKAADNDTGADVVVASVQTLARASRLDQLTAHAGLVGQIGLVIVDECHHAAAPSYIRIMTELGCYTRGEEDSYGQWPGTRAVGFTATMARGDGVGLGGVWEDVVYTKTTLWMIAHGYLTDVRGRVIDLELDLSQVKTSGGDYQAKSLGNALMDMDAPASIARAVQQHAADRRPIVFTPDVATAHATAHALNFYGIACDVVDGTTPREARLATYAAFRTGRIQALVNCMVLTEGADMPWADCAVIARPTKSAGLYIQMVGRVLRPWPGKADALVLNVIGEGGTLCTLIDLDPGLIVPPEGRESLAEAYVRQEERAERTYSSDHLAFDLKFRDIDMFESSTHKWLRTPAGVMFLSRGDGDVFLWPERDERGWMVGFAAANGRAWEPLHRELSLTMAMAWAETEAGSGLFNLSAKDKRWRKEPADGKQIGKARSIGLDPGSDPRKGELSDAISIALAAQKFDRRMRSLER